MKKKTTDELYKQLITAINNKPTKDNPIPVAAYNFNIAAAKLDYLRNQFLTEHEETKTDTSKEYVKTVFVKRIKKLLSDIQNRGALETRMEIKYIDMFQASIDDIEAYCSNKEDTKEQDAPKETPDKVEGGVPEPKETELSEKIKTHFGFLNKNCPRKHRQILNDEDFEKLIKWTIEYFENSFNLPKISEPIKVVNTNKTFVQLAFKYLFKKLHKSSPYPETLFELYRSAFEPYSEDKGKNFFAVKDNDEVKKLMGI